MHHAESVNVVGLLSFLFFLGPFLEEGNFAVCYKKLKIKIGQGLQMSWPWKIRVIQ